MKEKERKKSANRRSSSVEESVYLSLRYCDTVKMPIIKRTIPKLKKLDREEFSHQCLQMACFTFLCFLFSCAIFLSLSASFSAMTLCPRNESIESTEEEVVASDDAGVGCADDFFRECCLS